jgi:hypothetical protein
MNTRSSDLRIMLLWERAWWQLLRGSNLVLRGLKRLGRIGDE